MGGSTPDWAETEDYATLEEVFASRTFGRPLPEGRTHCRVPAAAAAVATATRPASSAQPHRRVDRRRQPPPSPWSPA